MDISKAEYLLLKRYIERARDDPSLEFEVMIKSPIDREAFENVMVLLQDMGFHCDHPRGKESLDIRITNQDEWAPFRYVLEDKESTVTYCRENRLPPVGAKQAYHVDKKHAVGGAKPVEIRDYFLKAALRKDEQIDDEAVLTGFQQAVRMPRNMKYFRYKNRFSFVKEDFPFRVDMTIVKSTPARLRTGTALFIDAMVLGAPETFEIELEYIHDQQEVAATSDTSAKTKWVLQELCNVAGHIVKVVGRQEVLMKASEAQSVVDSYLELTGWKKKVEDALRFPKKAMVGPKAVTMQMVNLLAPEPGVNSILKGYTVTEKADGERHLMYIDDRHRVFLINDRLHVTFTGLKHKAHSRCLLDGELVTKSRLGDDIRSFLVFDMYWHGGKPVHSLPLWDSSAAKETRLSHAMECIRAGFDGGSLSVRVKEFLGREGPDMLADCKALLEKDRLSVYEYTIDGLIFTPAALGAKLDGTWDKVFKWKPVEDNTIDFLVECAGDVTINQAGVSKRCRLVNLLVGYRPFSDELNGVAVLTGAVAAQKNAYVPRQWAVVYLPVEDDGNIYTELREPISSHMVMECAYDAMSDTKWIPKRIRTDKTDLLRKTRSISNTANDFKTAQANWRTIEMPITREMITGKVAMDREKVLQNMEEAYYFRDIQRDKSALKPLLDFHNHGIKKDMLLSRFKGKGMSLFDMGMGKAGDLAKWIDAGYPVVVGVDISRENLLDPKDGAWARYLEKVEQKVLAPTKQKMLFMNMDSGQAWTDPYIMNLPDETNRYLAQIAFDVHVDKIPELELRPFKGIAKRGLDVVSCQFAVHYFFGNDEMLNTFCQNVNKVLKAGGYFVGTCMDGFLVDQLLRDKAVGQRAEGKAADGSVLWMVTKEYPSYDMDVPENNMGLRIKNYIQTINRNYEEYLVDFELLKRKLAAFGIVPLSTAECAGLGLPASSGTFREAYDNMDQAKKKKGFEMNDVLQTYSFLNRWFVFRKA